MSRIYFHSQEGTAEVRGSERAHAAVLTQDLTRAGFGPMWESDPSRPHQIRKLITPGTFYNLNDPLGDFRKSFDLWLNYHDKASFTLPDGRVVPAWDVVLNTAHRLGEPSVKLLTRLHAQAEIHCWVWGPNRNWLAKLIERGRKLGIMRSNMGWESVIDLLRSSDERSVVCSYSVCEQFPNYGIADWDPPECRDEETGDEWDDYDAWYDLPAEEQWLRGMRGLNKADEGLTYSRELKPENFDAYIYGSGVSAFDLTELYA